MSAPDSALEAMSPDAHAVIHAAKEAGVNLFAAGIDETPPPLLVSATGTVAAGDYPWASPLNGSFTVLELPFRYHTTLPGSDDKMTKWQDEGVNGDINNQQSPINNCR